MREPNYRSSPHTVRARLAVAATLFGVLFASFVIASYPTAFAAAAVGAGAALVGRRLYTGVHGRRTNREATGDRCVSCGRSVSCC